MPRGKYLHLESGLVEEFQCAPGPAGWRYVSALADLTVDSRWRPARLQVTRGAWTLRGGASGADLMWVRAPSDGSDGGSEHAAAAHGFFGVSPAFLVAVARSLALEPGGSRDIAVVAVSEPSLAARSAPQRWTFAGAQEHPTDLGALPVQAWTLSDLETGEVAAFHLAGDVVLDAPGIELAALESPPNL